MTHIDDVAKLAGVSKATVSRAFNQPDSLKTETLQRVLAAAKELRFLPNPIARGLVTGRTGIVGLIIPDITNPYFSYIASGCSNELNHKQLSIALYNTNEQESLEYSTRSLVNQGHADGLIIMSEAASVSEVVDVLPETQTPTVYIERESDSPYVDSIMVDNLTASRLATEHLIGLGHRKIAIVTGLMRTITGRQRFQGFADTLAAHDISLPDEYVLEGNFKLECGVEMAQRIMALADPPTAVFFSSDLMVYGAVGELAANGWRVPEDISIIGCEDLPMSVCFSPRITTIRVPIYGLGRCAAQKLVKRLAKPKRKRSIEVLDVELVVRQSTRAAH